MASLKALGLNIRRAKLKSGMEQKFYVTDARTSEKVGARRAEDGDGGAQASPPSHAPAADRLSLAPPLPP